MADCDNRKKKKHVVVCGAGIMGLTTSYFLSKLGHSVVCVEKHSGVSEVASYRNGALMDPCVYSSWASPDLVKKAISSVFSSGKSAVKISPSIFLNPDLYSWAPRFALSCLPHRAAENSSHVLELSLYSMTCLKRFEAQHGGEVSMGRSAVGTLEMSKSSAELDGILTSARAKSVVERGYSFTRLKTSEDVEAVEPCLAGGAAAAGAIRWLGGGTSGDVHWFSQGLQRMCEKQGVRFLFGREVVGLEAVRGRDSSHGRTQIGSVRLCDGSRLEADAVVLAAGNATPQLASRAGVMLPMLAVKGLVLSVPLASSARLNHNIYFPGGVGLISPLSRPPASSSPPSSSSSPSSAPSPSGGVVNISGTVEFCAPSDFSVDEGAADALLRRAAALFRPGTLAQEFLVAGEGEKEPEKSHVLAHTCFRPLSCDDVPIIGRAPRHTNLYVNCGHGSKGWTMALGSGALLADLIDGRKPEVDAQPFSPYRFLISLGPLGGGESWE